MNMREVLRSTLVLFLVSLAGHALEEKQPCPHSIAYGQNDDAGRFANVNGIAMYYETYGSGPPLLLIHGNGGSISSMRCQIPHFSRFYRVIAADGRSHGKTEDGTARLTYEQMADDLAELLTQMKVDSVDIIGHSDGGIIALLLAIRHPSRVKALVASGPNLRPDGTAIFPWLLPFYTKAVKQADTMLAQGDKSKNWARIKRWNELMLAEPQIPANDLWRIKAPTLIVGGDEDVIRPEHLLEIYRAVPQAHLFIVPGATHFILREEYEWYNRAAERFLTRPFTRPTSRQVLEQMYK
jgi:pimeloyl-ACP methyl ester carboxylesterase